MPVEMTKERLMILLENILDWELDGQDEEDYNRFLHCMGFTDEEIIAWSPYPIEENHDWSVK